MAVGHTMLQFDDSIAGRRCGVRSPAFSRPRDHRASQVFALMILPSDNLSDYSPKTYASLIW